MRQGFYIVHLYIGVEVSYENIIHKTTASTYDSREFNKYLLS